MIATYIYAYFVTSIGGRILQITNFWVIWGENKLKINVFVKINYQNETKIAHIILFQRVIIFINDYAVIYST